MKTLFINATMGNSDSHTLALCRAYLQGCKDVEEVDLAALKLPCFDSETAMKRSELNEAGKLDDPIFDLAHQLAEADEVVIGAPYWDLSFPSALKVYVEHTCVNNLTFHYTEQGTCEGLCKSRRMVYVSSCGGYVSGANYGYEYMRGIAAMYGLGETYQVAAEGMDVVGNDPTAIMADALKRISELKAELA